MIQATRVAKLNRAEERGGQFVLYWMQASQRTLCNHALEYAIRQANDNNLPVVVYFGLYDSYPEANQRHYRFMLEGLREVQGALEKRGIRMVIRYESPDEGVVKLAEKAAMLVCDRGYLRLQRKWRQNAARKVGCPCIQVESDAVVPVEQASGKEEYSAATLRPKIYRNLPDYLQPLEERLPAATSLGLELDSLNVNDIGSVLNHLQIDRSTGTVSAYVGGQSQAEALLDNFLAVRLDRYGELRNDPNADSLSSMSPYLHFGQISPLYITLKSAETDSPGVDSYLEELVIRRELALNYVLYNPDYDSFEGLPAWAKKTLRQHEADPRTYSYSLEELQTARTHDPYWNAAQMEMVATGKMHGYMRMYWGKKIIEWSPDPQKAFERCLYLNNRHELDGRDPNSYAGVAWCFGKHDRPWGIRPVFGSVRYMNDRGLRRKFDADAYAEKVNSKFTD
ncbi:MAG: deoxyribodipyrimidine photo-lyase [Dehalococcoidaceae bacterium]|nr:deoxyribodipyrimidine photo-lyase [Dehalococcoidaceae bacterium]